MLQHFFGLPFWQSVAGAILVNALSALGIGTAIMTFIVFVFGAAWRGRKLIIGWSALAVTVFLMLEAIRFNTVSAKESTISSLGQSVERLNQQLTPRHLSANQANCLTKKLLASSPSQLPLMWAAASAEAFRYAGDFGDAFTNAKWTVPNPVNAIPGVALLVNSKKTPPAAEVARDAFKAYGIPFSWWPDSQISDWNLYVGQRP